MHLLRAGNDINMVSYWLGHADILCISVRTVERHKYNMMQELNLKTTADLIKYAIKQGIAFI